MKKFTTAINGYDKTEVNDFVLDVTKEYESMLNNLKERDLEISRLQEQLKYYQNLESTLNRAVLVAEDSSTQMKKIAKEEAKNIIDDAKKNASYIVNDALMKAAKIENDVEYIKRSVKVYKSRIREIINEQLSIVDDIDNIEFENKE